MERVTQSEQLDVFCLNSEEGTVPEAGTSFAVAFDHNSSQRKDRRRERSGRTEEWEGALRKLFDIALLLVQKGKTGSTQVGDVQWLMRFLSTARSTLELRDFLQNNLSGTSVRELNSNDKHYLNRFIDEWIRIRKVELEAYFEKKSAEEAM